MRTPTLSWINKHNVTEVHRDSFHSCIYIFSYFCATLNDFINNTSDMHKTMVSRKSVFTQAMYKLKAVTVYKVRCTKYWPNP